MSAPAQALPQSQTLPTPAATTNWAPTAKVSAGILAASITTLLLPFLGKAQISLSATEAAAVTTLITFVIQYVVPERK